MALQGLQVPLLLKAPSGHVVNWEVEPVAKKGEGLHCVGADVEIERSPLHAKHLSAVQAVHPGSQAVQHFRQRFADS